MSTGFVIGWSDATPGPLIPRWEEEYQLSYLKASLVFVAVAAGLTTMTPIIEPVFTRVGQLSLPTTEHTKSLSWWNRPKVFCHQQAVALTTLSGCLLHLVYFAVPASHPPFFGVIIAAWIGGNGQTAVFAQMNTYCASQTRASLLLGCFHASYGMVCTDVPTGLNYSAGERLGVAPILRVAATFLPDKVERAWSYRLDRTAADKALERAGAEKDRDMSHALALKLGVSDLQLPQLPVTEPRAASSMMDTIRDRFTWFMAFFMFLYQGIEVTTGGWNVSYIIDVRRADPQYAGYAATGFWADMTIGRISFAVFSSFVSWQVEKHAVHGLILLSLAVIFVMWFVDSIIAGALGAAVLGVLQGPVIQVTVMIMAKLADPRLLLNTITVSTSVSCVGSAVMPFVCGAASSATKTVQLMPILVSLCSGMLLLWACVPTQTGVPGNLLFGLGGRPSG